MANPTGPSAAHFRAQLDDGQTVETDGTTIADPTSGTQLPAIVLRMTRARAHTLAHVLDDWCRTALVFTTLNSSEITELLGAVCTEATTVNLVYLALIEPPGTPS